jgi:hypothetical protein
MPSKLDAEQGVVPNRGSGCPLFARGFRLLLGFEARIGRLRRSPKKIASIDPTPQKPNRKTKKT